MDNILVCFLTTYQPKCGHFCYVHSIFRFLFLVTFCDEVTKIQKYYVIFVYILQDKMGKTEKTGKKIMQLKWPKYQKLKDEIMGWTKHKKPKSIPWNDNLPTYLPYFLI